MIETISPDRGTELVIYDLLTEKNMDVFLTGRGGTGKTYTIKKLIEIFDKESVPYILTAMTGIAAKNISPYASTVHSALKLGICQDIEEYKTGYSKYDPDLHKLISSLKVIVIDEISFCSATFLEVIVHHLDKYNFKGRLLFVGDFHQLPPVEGDFCFNSSEWWPYTIELSEIKRTSDLEFIDLCNMFRDMDFDGIKNNRYFDRLLAQDDADITNDKGVNIYSTNNEVIGYNTTKLNALIKRDNVKKHILNGSVNIIRYGYVTDKNVWEYINAERTVELCIGAKVMMLENTALYSNGTTGIVVDIVTGFLDVVDSIDVELDNGQVVKIIEKRYEVQRKTLTGEVQVVATATQFPLKLAWAITVHKSQGLTIDLLKIDFKKFFLSSQFYVALTRASKPENIVIYNFSFKKFERMLDDDHEEIQRFYATGYKEINNEVLELINS